MLNANNCWHFNIYEHDKFHVELRLASKSFITSRQGFIVNAKHTTGEKTPNRITALEHRHKYARKQDLGTFAYVEKPPSNEH